MPADAIAQPMGHDHAEDEGKNRRKIVERLSPLPCRGIDPEEHDVRSLGVRQDPVMGKPRKGVEITPADGEDQGDPEQLFDADPIARSGFHSRVLRCDLLRRRCLRSSPRALTLNYRFKVCRTAFMTVALG